MSDDRSLGRFLRGLTIGALIGAVVAGSRFWSRRRADDERRGPPDRPVSR